MMRRYDLCHQGLSFKWGRKREVLIENQSRLYSTGNKIQEKWLGNSKLIAKKSVFEMGLKNQQQDYIGNRIGKGGNPDKKIMKAIKPQLCVRNKQQGYSIRVHMLIQNLGQIDQTRVTGEASLSVGIQLFPLSVCSTHSQT